jgi:hypothetical protein
MYGQISDWQLNPDYIKTDAVRRYLNGFVDARLVELDKSVLSDGAKTIDMVTQIAEAFEQFKKFIGSAAMFSYANVNREINFEYMAQRFTRHIQNEYDMMYRVTCHGIMLSCLKE